MFFSLKRLLGEQLDVCMYSGACLDINLKKKNLIKFWNGEIPQFIDCGLCCDALSSCRRRKMSIICLCAEILMLWEQRGRRWVLGVVRVFRLSPVSIIDLRGRTSVHPSSLTTHPSCPPHTLQHSTRVCTTITTCTTCITCIRTTSHHSLLYPVQTGTPHTPYSTLSVGWVPSIHM